MSAPKGNEYYKRRQKDGRELIFAKPEDLLAKAYEYFDWCKENPMYKNEAIRSGVLAGRIIKIPTDRPYTIEGLCVYAEISTQTFLNYGEREDFFAVTTHVREIIRQNQLEGAMIEAYSPNIVARVLGLSDKRDIKAEVDNGLTINITPKDKSKESIENATSTKNNLEALKEKLGGE